MDRKYAQKIERSVACHIGLSPIFHIEKIQMNTKKIEVISAFRIRRHHSIYRFIFGSIVVNKPEIFYLRITQNRENASPRSLAEIHESTSQELNWSYRPAFRDKENEKRKNRFVRMYGSLNAKISIPMGNVSVDDFLTDLFCLVELRATADQLDLNIIDYENWTFLEGKRTERIHKSRERSPALVNVAKEQYAEQNNGRLPCQVCRFDFQKIYGDRGSSFIEAHHMVPLQDLVGDAEIETNVNDLAMVCSNCHRMLHKHPFMDVDQLRELLESR